MLHWLFEDGDWFEPKRYGYGAGLPIAWQGWAVLGGYMLLVLGLALLAPAGGLVLLTIALPLITLATWGLIVITREHTRGGWRWRWGEED